MLLLAARIGATGSSLAKASASVDAIFCYGVLVCRKGCMLCSPYSWRRSGCWADEYFASSASRVENYCDPLASA